MTDLFERVQGGAADAVVSGEADHHYLQTYRSPHRPPQNIENSGLMQHRGAIISGMDGLDHSPVLITRLRGKHQQDLSISKKRFNHSSVLHFKTIRTSVVPEIRSANPVLPAPSSPVLSKKAE